MITPGIITLSVLLTTFILINSIITLCYLGTDKNSDKKIDKNDWKRRYLIGISYFMIVMFLILLFLFYINK